MYQLLKNLYHIPGYMGIGNVYESETLIKKEINSDILFNIKWIFCLFDVWIYFLWVRLLASPLDIFDETWIHFRLEKELKCFSRIHLKRFQKSFYTKFYPLSHSITIASLSKFLHTYILTYDMSYKRIKDILCRCSFLLSFEQSNIHKCNSNINNTINACHKYNNTVSYSFLYLHSLPLPLSCKFFGS